MNKVYNTIHETNALRGNGSGGLLFRVKAEDGELIMKEFSKIHMDSKVAMIGRVTEKKEKLIKLI